MFKTARQEMCGASKANVAPMATAIAASIRYAFVTSARWAATSERPFASPISVMTPAPMPRSAKLNSTLKELINIHTPKRSGPR